MIKKTVFSFLFILCFSCSPKNSELKEFNKFLGEEKAESLDELVISFQEFLNINYTATELGEKTKQFLADMEIQENPKWEFENENNKNVLVKIEKSGLRKEMYIYDSDDYTSEHSIYVIFKSPYNKTSANTFELGELQPDDFNEEYIPLYDSSYFHERTPDEPIDYFSFNVYGEYLYALAKYFQTDTVISQYIDIKLIVGDISPSLMSGGLLIGYSIEELKSPIVQRIIAVEFYYPMLKYVVENDLYENKFD